MPNPNIPAELAALLAPGLLSDEQIEYLCRHHDMISPAVYNQQREKGVVSYGLSSYGYDARLGQSFKVFTNVNSDGIIDPKNFSPDTCVTKMGKTCVIPPNGFILGHTVEYFKVPNDVLVVCLGKSTYARCFSQDSTLALNDGTTVSFVDAWRRIQSGEELRCVAFDDNGEIVNPVITNLRRVGTDNVRLLTFTDGSTVKVTDDHLMWSLDADTNEVVKVAASKLTPNSGFKQFSYNSPKWDLKLVTSVPQTDPEDVYCFETEEGNFLLGNGIAVDNCGAIVNVTPLEPGWEGQVTIEISNTTPLPLRVYADEGICQFLFIRGSAPCLKSYRDKLGKYMGQTGVTTARVEGLVANPDAVVSIPVGVTTRNVQPNPEPLDDAVYYSLACKVRDMTRDTSALETFTRYVDILTHNPQAGHLFKEGKLEISLMDRNNPYQCDVDQRQKLLKHSDTGLGLVAATPIPGPVTSLQTFCTCHIEHILP